MTKLFWKKCLIRVAHTVCQCAIGAIGTAVMIQDVNWAAVLSTVALAGVTSLLKSVLVGLPEVEEE